MRVDQRDIPGRVEVLGVCPSLDVVRVRARANPDTEGRIETHLVAAAVVIPVQRRDEDHFPGQLLVVIPGELLEDEASLGLVPRGVC